MLRRKVKLLFCLALAVLSFCAAAGNVRRIYFKDLENPQWMAPSYDSLNRAEKRRALDNARLILRRDMVRYYYIVAHPKDTEPHTLEFTEAQADEYFEHDPDFRHFDFEHAPIKFDDLASDWVITSESRRRLMQEIGPMEADLETLRMLLPMLRQEANRAIVKSNLSFAEAATSPATCPELLTTAD